MDSTLLIDFVWASDKATETQILTSGGTRYDVPRFDSDTGTETCLSLFVAALGIFGSRLLLNIRQEYFRPEDKRTSWLERSTGGMELPGMSFCHGTRDCPVSTVTFDY
jgi:hypothetical protein